MGCFEPVYNCNVTLLRVQSLFVTLSAGGLQIYLGILGVFIILVITHMS